MKIQLILSGLRVSLEKSGASHGYGAAGGPGFTGPTDTVGQLQN